MKYDFVIIGGGVAGLSAAMRLTELGANPLIVEAGNYPAHKVCGEFFSSQSIPVLEKWKIKPVPISAINIHSDLMTVEYRFPSPAGSLSHFKFDTQLAEKAVQQGAKLLTQTKVTHLHFENNLHLIELSSGQKISASNLILATGRLPNFKQNPTAKFVGIKAHLNGTSFENNLEMFLFKEAYVGISPIEDGKCNFACLVKKDLFDQCKTSLSVIEHLKSQNSLFNQLLSKTRYKDADWLQAFIPHFGIKKPPRLPHAYFIGDARATIPPITGNGLSMAIQSGMMAAEYALEQDFSGFEKAWNTRFKRSIFFGKLFHTCAIDPRLRKSFIHLAALFPGLKDMIFRYTR